VTLSPCHSSRLTATLPARPRPARPVMTFRTPLYGLVLMSPLGLAGCDSKPPPLVAAHGRVTLYDVPLRNGMVVFTPDAERGTYGPNAVGTIGPDGQYALMTDGSPGVTPGLHPF